MIFPKAKKIAKKLNWHKTKNGVFGLYKGYFFNIGDASIMNNPQFKYVILKTDILSEQQEQQLRSEINKNKEILKFTNLRIGTNSIYIQFIENFSFTKLKTVYSLLDFLVDLCKQLNISEYYKCHNCTTKENLDFYYLNNDGLLLCSSCFSELEKQFQESERIRLSEYKSHFAGFLGAILFSIPGIIVWVLIAVYIGLISSGMAAITAFMGLKGYEYFKGRDSKLTKYLIILCNIISILIANIATIVFLLVKEGLTIGQSFQELEVNSLAQDIFFKNSFISFVLGCCAWIWILSQIKQKAMTIKLAEKF